MRTNVTNHNWVSHSELGTFKQCRLKHSFSYVDRLQRSESSRPLALGSAFHEVMEAHYKGDEERVLQLLQPTKVVAAKGILKGLSMGEDFSPVLQRMYAGHIERYGYPEDEEFELLGVEETLMVPIPNPTTHVEFVKIKMDILGRSSRGVFVLDHKSGNGKPTSIEDLELDNQFKLYVWAANEMGYDCRWACRSYARTDTLKTRELSLDERFDRQWVHVNSVQVGLMFEELRADLEAMALSTGATRSPHKDCAWKCDFRDTCQASAKKPKLEQPMLDAGGFESEIKFTDREETKQFHGDWAELKASVSKQLTNDGEE